MPYGSYRAVPKAPCAMRCHSTDQAIAFGNGNVTDEVIRQMLGLIDQADVIAMLIFISKIPSNWRNPFSFCVSRWWMLQSRIWQVGWDATSIGHFAGLAKFLIYQINRQQSEQLFATGSTVTRRLLQLYYDIVVKSRWKLGIVKRRSQSPFQDVFATTLDGVQALHRNQIRFVRQSLITLILKVPILSLSTPSKSAEEKHSTNHWKHSTKHWRKYWTRHWTAGIWW